MAVDDSAKRARLLPCLAILRYTVATVVTVLAVVVIVKVIAVGVRPDDVSVSVVQGHVGIIGPLWYENTTDVDAEPTPTATATTISRRGARPAVDCMGAGGRGAPYSKSGSCSGSGGRDFSTHGSVIYGRLPTRTVYDPVKALSLEVILSVDNPSGRGIIYCKSINVSFYAGTAAAGMKIWIGMLQLPSSLDFNVKPQTSHVIAREVTFDDTTMLKQIADTYGGESSFTGTVEVTMNTSSVVLGHHNPFSIVTLVCSQVYFSVFDATATATSVQCAKSN